MLNKISCPQAFRAAMLENGSLWRGAKNIWEASPRHIGHVCKNKNYSVKFLVRAEVLIRPRRRRQNNAKHYKHPDSIGDA